MCLCWIDKVNINEFTVHNAHVNPTSWVKQKHNFLGVKHYTEFGTLPIIVDISWER